MRVIGNLRVRIGADMSGLDQAVERSIARTGQLSKTTDAATAAAARLTATSSTTAVTTNAAASAAARAAIANVGVASAAHSAAAGETALASAAATANTALTYHLTQTYAAAGAQAHLKATAGLATAGLAAQTAAAKRGGQQMTYFAVVNRVLSGQISSVGAAMEMLRGPRSKVQQMGDAFLRNNHIVRGGFNAVSGLGGIINWAAGGIAKGAAKVMQYNAALLDTAAKSKRAHLAAAGMGTAIAGGTTAALVRGTAATAAFGGRAIRAAADLSKLTVGAIRELPGLRRLFDALGGLTVRLTRLPAATGAATAAVAKMAAATGRSFVSIAAGAAKATLAVGALGAAMVAALVNKGMASVTALAKNADALGITTESFRRLEHAARLEGIDPKILTDGLGKGLETIAQGAADAEAPIHRALAGIGLQIRDLTALAPDEQFSRIAAAMQRAQDPAANLRAAFHLFGEEGMALVNVLQRGQTGLAKAAADADKLGLAMNRIDAAKVELAHIAFSRLWASIATTAEKLTVLLAPAITMVVDYLTELRTVGPDGLTLLEKGFHKAIDAAVWLLDTGESLVTKFYEAQIAFTSFAASLVRGFADALKAGGLLNDLMTKLANPKTTAAMIAEKNTVFQLSRQRANLANAPGVGRAQELRDRAGQLAALDTEIEGAQRRIAAMQVKLNKAAGGGMLDNASKTVEGMAADIKAALPELEKNLAARNAAIAAGGGLGQRFRDGFNAALAKVNAGAAARAAEAVKGAKPIAAEEKAKDQQGSKPLERKFDNPFLDARGKEAFSAIVQHQLGKGSTANPVESNTKETAKQTKITNRLLDEIKRKLLAPPVPPQAVPIPP